MHPKNISFLEYQPRSQLVTKETLVTKSKYPSIDGHNHLRRIVNDPTATNNYIVDMEACGVQAVVDLDGGWGETLQNRIDIYRKYPGKVHVFCHIDFSTINEANFACEAVKSLEDSVNKGAKGLKIFKNLGLGVKVRNSEYLPIDTPKLDPVWARCGELGIPVLMHTGDPVAFFTPLDKYNERLRELADHPHWAFEGNEYYSKAELLNQRNRVIERHPNTTFIGAHIANAPENLELVKQWLDEFPNLYVDTSARLSELGRQPYTARQFFIDYQDRIIFGTDGNAMGQSITRMYQLHWRFFETYDEYFDITDSHKVQGDWRVYGLGLPDLVLEKIYFRNILKLLK
ncbi:MAG: amidohydrolase [Firmicutes bacterium]|nr:amidohydrolase [Bacillota bacterium]